MSRNPEPPALIPPVASPVTAAEFAALMEAVGLTAATTAPLAVAVSGGPDSMALACCAQRWAGDKPMIALIVDHQLRPESGAEAETTRQRLTQLGLRAEILRWEHPPVTTRLHSVARKARYGLLLAACRRHGATHLLLAHQREDQAETILMRLAKGSGVDGLAGMAAEAVVEGVQLLRPLLALPKARLIATCDAAGLPYILDPSNAAAKYARGRLRRVMPLLADEGLTVERLTDLGDRAREAKEALEHYTDIFLRDALRHDFGGVLRLDLDALRAAPRAIAFRALSRCLRMVHHGDYPPERTALIALYAALCHDAPMPPRTLHGCLVKKSAESVVFLREWTAIRDVQPIHSGESVAWDGRWRVSLDAAWGLGALRVQALGMQPHSLLDQLAPALRKQLPQGRARAALPSLWRENALVLIPALHCGDKAMAEATLLAVDTSAV